MATCHLTTRTRTRYKKPAWTVFEGATRTTTSEQFLEPAIETMARDDLARMQEEKVLELLPYAYERSGLYREIWDEAGVHPKDIKNIDDFRARIPFITKDSIRSYRDRHGDPFGGLLCIDRADLTWATSSSGTTGDATFFAERWDECSPLPLQYARAIWGMGVRPGDHVVGQVPLFRGRVDMVHRRLGTIPIWANNWFGGWTEVIDLILKYRPTFTGMISPIVIELHHLSRKYDLTDVFSSFKGVAFAGEPLGAVMKNKIRSEWGLKLYTYTSAGDTGIAWECSSHDGYHLWEDTVLAENIDQNTKLPVADGTVGELVCTAIDDTVAPLIRYRADDLIRTDTRPCSCGRTHTRMWVLGRAGDETVVGGKTILPTEVWAAVEQLPETHTGLFQIIRPTREVDQLKLRVGYDPETTADVADLEDRLRRAILAAVDVEPFLVLETEEEILARGTAAKVPRVVKE